MYFKQINEIIAGTKTQTRRVVKPGEDERIKPVEGDTLVKDSKGDLWVRGYIWKKRDIVSVYTAANRLKWRVDNDYAVSPGRGLPGVWWNPLTGEWAIPYTTKRYKFDGPQRLITDMKRDKWQPLRIVIAAIRREPLQDITEADAVAEGCEPEPCPRCGGNGIVTTLEADPNGDGAIPWQWQCGCYGGVEVPPTTLYRNLWERINGAGSWDANPDVWVIEFRVKRESE